MVSGLLKKECSDRKRSIGCNKDDDWFVCTSKGRNKVRAGTDWWSWLFPRVNE